MRAIASCVMTMALLATQCASAAGPVELSLDGEWDFTYTASSTASIPQLPATAEYDAAIKVPGRWDDQLDRLQKANWWPHAQFRTTIGPVRYLSGIGWHRKVIDIPSDWVGRAKLLTIGRAVGTSHVWLNKTYLGASAIGVYTPFEIDVTNKLLAGQKNELVVAIDNGPLNVFGGWALLGNAGMASGLARPVTLRVAPGAGRITDVYIKPGADLREIAWQIDLSLPANSERISASKLTWVVRNTKDKRELARGNVDVPAFSDKRGVTWTTRVPEIRPWSDREPNLYLAELTWETSGEQQIDVCEQRFGLRRWTYEGRKLFLNGEPHYLRMDFGAYYFPIEGAVSVSKKYWLEHMRCVKELGLNAINFAAQVCPPEMLEAADEMGIILQCGDYVTAQQAYNDRYGEVWPSIVKLTRGHPSMAIYGFGGELDYYEGSIEHFGAQRDLIKKLHPESLVMPQQAIRGIDYSFGDATVVQEPFPHHAERLARYTQACDLFGHYSGGAFSYTYFDTSWREMEKRFTIYKKPLVAHEIFISASYLDPHNAANYRGRIPPYLYSRLHDDLQAAELLGKWPTYFDHTSRLQHICRKYCMEKIRKCNELAGFELLGLMDMHFTAPEYAVGILDEFLAMKPGDTSAGVRRYSNESVLLLDFDQGNSINRCYRAGESFNADVLVSLFGPSDIEEGELIWTLNDGTKKVNWGSEAVRAPRGSVSKLQELKITWPKVKRTKKLNLSIKLAGNGCTLSNDWDFWIFPNDPPPQVLAAADGQCLKLLGKRYPGIHALTTDANDQLRIISKLGEKDVKHLAGGGDVLQLGGEPFTEYTAWPYFYPAMGFRSHSNGGTIIAQHPIFAGHPHEGWGDWQFYPILNGANCVLFDGAIDIVFDPIVEVISSAGNVRRQALVFEQRVGKGRLLVSTAALNLENPSCSTLLDNTLRYMSSAQFQPKHSLDRNELLRSRSSKDRRGNQLLDSSFERLGYWICSSGHYEIDHSTAYRGKASLKLIVTEDHLRESRQFASALTAPPLSFRSRSHRIKLAGWFKADLSESKGGPKVVATIRNAGTPTKSEAISIQLNGPAADWRYLEKAIDVDAEEISANVSIEFSGVAGTAWVDDLYFGEAPIETTNQALPANPDSARPVDVKWQNVKFTRRFDAPVSFRINKEEWKNASTIEIAREGVHEVSVKDPKDGNHVEEIRIDLSPPVVSLEISPLPKQEAGNYTASVDTQYAVTATDNLSGVKSIELSTDGMRFVPYVQPFRLPKGRHILRCRATDRAGNVSQTMTGGWITGNAAKSLDVTVVHDKN
jgi:hypothetical protein